MPRRPPPVRLASSNFGERVLAVTTKLLGDRLRAARTRLGLAIPELAKKVGVAPNTLGSYEREERALPDPEFLADFAKVTGDDLAQLLEARLAASKQAEALVAAWHALRNVARQDEAAYTYVPLYEIEAGAAPRGRIVVQERPKSELAFRNEWIRGVLGAGPENLSLIHVQGDSMEPDLRAGDIILIDHTAKEARTEGIYVVRIEDALLVKRVQRTGGGVLKLTSSNAAYEPLNLSLAELGKTIAIVGRVVWACRRY